MLKTFPNYYLFINGEDKDSELFDFFPVSDKFILAPLKYSKILSRLKKYGNIEEEETEIIVGKYYLANKAHIDHAIESAYSSFLEFKQRPLAIRSKILLDTKKYLLQEREEFISLLIAEGHPHKLAIWQYKNMINGLSEENINFYCSLIFQEKDDKKEKIAFIRKPDGVILVIPPRNAPASNSLLAISALLNGNTLIIKPPQKCPISTIFLWRNIVQKAIEENKCPKGVVNLIQGNSSLILDMCLDSDKIKTVCAFGESENGIELGKKIYSKSKKPILELSGNDRMIIWKDAPILEESFINAILEAFLGSSQICMLPKIIVIHPSIYDQLIQILLNKIELVKVGLPSDKSTWLSPVAKKKDYFIFLEDALTKGAKLLCGGKAINHKNEEDSNGLFIQPTFLRIDDCNSIFDMLVYKKEIFFPLIPLISAGNPNDTDEEVFNKMALISEKNAYGLRISIWIGDNKIKSRFIQEIDNCGSIRINSSHIGFSNFLSTHGGVGLTGGPLGELNYMCLRASHPQGISYRNDI